jgi:hypothetical protein
MGRVLITVDYRGGRQIDRRLVITVQSDRGYCFFRAN